jgi:hypothetical protein
MQKKHWADLPLCKKIGIIIGGAVQFGLLVLGLWDLGHRKADEVRGDRRMWVGLMFFNWIGPLTYFAYGRKDSPLCAWRCKDEQPAVIEETSVAEETAEFGGPAPF